MNADKFTLPAKFTGGEKNVWIEFSDLARKYKPLNLGQGAPDFAAPDLLRNALGEVVNSNDYTLHQYTRGFGHPRLTKVLSQLYSPLINHEISAQHEIIITNGASAALYYAIIGHVDAGDEVIIIEPYFDSYESLVLMAGGKPVFVPLRPKYADVASSSDLVLERSELEAAFNAKTKMIIVNSPHNPTGKVFTSNELQMIADLCIRWDVLCIYDEVYEWLVYKPHEHIRIAMLPKMWDRTLTIGSAGKSFSVTGWKIGWAYGPANLIYNLQVIHQNCVYTCCTPIQDAFARAYEHELEHLGEETSYFVSLTRMLEKKRDRTAKFLKEASMVPIVPDGGYFMLANWKALAGHVNLDTEKDIYKDYCFTKWMIKNIGLQMIPPSAFYSEEHKTLGEDYVRICFIKEDKNLEKGANILKKLIYSEISVQT